MKNKTPCEGCKGLFRVHSIVKFRDEYLCRRCLYKKSEMQLETAWKILNRGKNANRHR